MAVSHLTTSSSIFNALCTHYENLGVYTQVMLLQKALKLCFCPDIPLSQTTDEMDTLHRHIITISPFDDDKLCSVLFPNGLGKFFPQLQSTIQVICSSASFNSEMVLHAIH